jgi:TonB family protein
MLPLTAIFLFLMVPQSLVAQEAQPYVPKYDVKKCAPKVLNKKPFSPPKGSQPRKGEKATGHSPVIAFEILESGEVVSARVKRTSGLADRDANALDNIRWWKFNSRPGCGTIEMQSDVSLHYH